MNELNVAALLDKDAYTVRVRFIKNSNAATNTSTLYQYICNLRDVAPGDLVLVPAHGVFHTAEIAEVDTILQITPGESIKYKWLAAKVDLSAHYKLMGRNDIIEAKVLDVYKRRLRYSFSEALIETATEAERKDILALLPSAAN